VRHQSAIARSRAAGVEPWRDHWKGRPCRAAAGTSGVTSSHGKLGLALPPTPCRRCGSRALSEMSGKETSCGGWRGFYDCVGASQR
jgi:ribosomal protein L37E